VNDRSGNSNGRYGLLKTKKAACGSAGYTGSRGRRMSCLFGEREGVRVMQISNTFQKRRFCISGTLFLFHGAIFWNPLFFIADFLKNSLL